MKIGGQKKEIKDKSFRLLDIDNKILEFSAHYTRAQRVELSFLFLHMAWQMFFHGYTRLQLPNLYIEGDNKCQLKEIRTI